MYRSFAALRMTTTNCVILSAAKDLYESNSGNVLTILQLSVKNQQNSTYLVVFLAIGAIVLLVVILWAREFICLRTFCWCQKRYTNLWWRREFYSQYSLE